MTATDIMWHDLRAFRNPDAIAGAGLRAQNAGAGGHMYYLATAADQIVVHPTSIVGGIGVILNLYNLQDTMAQFNISAEPIKAGKQPSISARRSPRRSTTMGASCCKPWPTRSSNAYTTHRARSPQES